MPGLLCRYLTGWVLAALLAGPLQAQVSPSPTIPAKTVTITEEKPTLGGVLKTIETQTGLAVDAVGLNPSSPSVALKETPFWTALEQAAERAGALITLGQGGRKVTLTRRTGPPQPSFVNGPFRVAVSRVRPTIDFETGQTFTELTLDIHWEPRFPVFRLDAQPTLTTIEDDQGGKLSAVTAKARTPPAGTVYTTSVRIDGISRKARRLSRVSGSFVVTASPKMLAFTFSDPTGKTPMAGVLPTGELEKRVSAILRRFEKVGDVWEAEFELIYPPDGPEFESFESWVTENRARLIPPDRSRIIASSDEDVLETGRRTVAVYRFKGVDPFARPGWSLVYETPAPLIEFRVHFDLKEIPLP